MPWIVIWTLVNFLGVVLVAPFSPRLASRWFAVLWARGLLFAIPARLRVSGREHIDPELAYVVVCNHLSLIDIPILYGWLPLDLKWVMKKELRRVPVIGQGSALLGHIFLDRSDSAAALATLHQVRRDLRPGLSIVLFPEGTRSRDGRLRSFKSGAFRLARDLEVPILPVTIVAADTILSPDGVDLHPGTAQMIIHPAIDRDAVLSSSIGELRNRARAAVASVLPPERVRSPTGVAGRAGVD